MQIFNTKNSLHRYLQGVRGTQKTTALVPTMGALHEGHLSLIRQAKQSADVTICSIFVNPTQFNDPKDLEKYPRPLENDIALLESVSCDVLFLPSVEEMYPDSNENWHLDLGPLETIWEGEHRPGHFQGVTQIVYKLFTAVQPNFACFGQKDFQQVMVVQKMIDVKQMPVKLIVCPIIRNPQGLALSSRNMRLSPEGKEKALIISKALQHVKAHFRSVSVDELTQTGSNIILSEKGVTPEYFSICETRTLQQVNELHADKEYVALVVAWVEGVRLLDNMLLNE